VSQVIEIFLRAISRLDKVIIVDMLYLSYVSIIFCIKSLKNERIQKKVKHGETLTYTLIVTR